MAAKRCRVLFVCYLCAPWSRDIKRALKGHKMPRGAQCSEREQLGAAVLGTLMWVHLKSKSPVHGKAPVHALSTKGPWSLKDPPPKENSICSRREGYRRHRTQKAHTCVHTHPSPAAPQVLAQPCCPLMRLPQSQHPEKLAGLGTAVLGLRHSFIHPCGMAMPFAVSRCFWRNNICSTRQKMRNQRSLPPGWDPLDLRDSDLCHSQMQKSDGS